MANPKKKQQKENDALAQSIINSGPKKTHNPITGQPYDAPLVDEHPGLDLALMYAQPGSIFMKALAPSMAKGTVNGLSNGEGAQALMYGLVPESSIVASTAVRNAQKASKDAINKAKELKKLKEQYRKLSDLYERRTSGWSYDDWDGLTTVIKSDELDDIASRIANLEYDLGMTVGDPGYLSPEKYWKDYWKRDARIQALKEELWDIEHRIPELQTRADEAYNRIMSSYGTQKPEFNVKSYAEGESGLTQALNRAEQLRRELKIGSNPIKVEKTTSAIDDLPFKNGGKIKSIF